MSPKKIFAAASGSYSDYRVQALFSTRALAEAYIAAFPRHDWNDVEEFDLDPPTVDLIKRGYRPWTVHMLRDGTVEKVWPDTDPYYPSAYNEAAYLWERTKAPATAGQDIPDALIASVLAKTEKAAVKIANERRVRMIADGKWAVSSERSPT